jgi:hypothetical protein
MRRTETEPKEHDMSHPQPRLLAALGAITAGALLLAGCGQSAPAPHARAAAATPSPCERARATLATVLNEVESTGSVSILAPLEKAAKQLDATADELPASQVTVDMTRAAVDLSLYKLKARARFTRDFDRQAARIQAACPASG